MSRLRFLINLYPLYSLFHHRLSERLTRALTPKVPMDALAADYFDVCVNLASDAIRYVECDEQRRVLNPIGSFRPMMNALLQDSFFDYLAEYTAESEYFDDYAIEELFAGNEVASVGVQCIGDVLKEVMSVLIQHPEGALFFDSDRCPTHNPTIVEATFLRTNPRNYDVCVDLGFDE